MVLIRRGWWTCFILADLDTELFIIELRGPGRLWATHGAGYEDQGEVGTKVVEGRTLGEITEVGGADSIIIDIEGRKSETKNKHQHRDVKVRRRSPPGVVQDQSVLTRRTPELRLGPLVDKQLDVTFQFLNPRLTSIASGCSNPYGPLFRGSSVDLDIDLDVFPLFFLFFFLLFFTLPCFFLPFLFRLDVFFLLMETASLYINHNASWVDYCAAK